MNKRSVFCFFSTSKKTSFLGDFFSLKSCLILLTLIGIHFCGKPVLSQDRDGSERKQALRSKEKSESSDDPLLLLQDRLAEIIEKTDLSVVAIARVGKRNPEDPTSPDFVPKEFGTGVVIGENGLILTCYHVLGDPAQNDYYVWISGTPFKVRAIEKASAVIAADPWTDLAIIKVDAKLKPIRLAPHYQPKRGQLVVSLGNPFGIAKDGNCSASIGIVSNFLRQRSVSTSSELTGQSSGRFSQYGTLLQTDAKLNRGTSGGPLINLKGEMVALTSALTAADRFDAAAGYAIPVDQTFLRTVERLKKGRSAEFGFLGIATRELTLAQRQQFKKGVVVTQVVENTPADLCGLQFGDVITHIDNKEVQSSSGLLRELSGRFAADEIEITIMRLPFPNSPPRRLELKAELGKKKIKGRQPTIGINDFSAWRGLEVDFATAVNDLASHHQLIDAAGCVAVVEVRDGSPADKAGLKPSQFISHVQQIRVSSPEQFFDVVQKSRGRVELQLTTIDSATGKTKTLTVE